MVLYWVSVPTVIWGDLMYPFQTWLMKPYPSINDPGKRKFKHKLSSCRMLMECMFGRLKSHWYCLWICLDSSGANAVCIVISCYTLHIVFKSKGSASFPSGHRRSLSYRPCTGSQIPLMCTLVLVLIRPGKLRMSYGHTSLHSREAKDDVCLCQGTLPHSVQLLEKHMMEYWCPLVGLYSSVRVFL